MFHTSCKFFVIFLSILLADSFKPLTKEEQIERITKMNQEVEPLRKNLTECAKQVKASAGDVENFLKRIPQSTSAGKCFVACILKRNQLIVKSKLVPKNLLEANRAVYGEDSDVMERLKESLDDCMEVVGNIFEICEYASLFNDCMHIRMEQILDKSTMDRRMEALGQMSSGDDEYWSDDDDLLQMMKDEL